MSKELPVVRSKRRADLVAEVGQTQFTLAVPVFDLADIWVGTMLTASQVEYVPADPAQYTLAFTAGEPGPVRVTFLAPPRLTASAPALKVRIEARRTHERVTNVTRNGVVQSRALETDFDRQAAVQQELRRDVTESMERLPRRQADNSFSFGGGRLADIAEGYGPNDVALVKQVGNALPLATEPEARARRPDRTISPQILWLLLDEMANSSDIDRRLALKADLAALLGKADTAAVNAALTGKADAGATSNRFISVETAISMLQAQQVVGATLEKTWAALAARAPTVNGQIAYVDTSDTGTHTDPVTGATVPNSGELRGSLSPLGWEYIGPRNNPAAATVPEMLAGLINTRMATPANVAALYAYVRAFMPDKRVSKRMVMRMMNSRGDLFAWLEASGLFGVGAGMQIGQAATMRPGRSPRFFNVRDPNGASFLSAGRRGVGIMGAHINATRSDDYLFRISDETGRRLFAITQAGDVEIAGRLLANNTPTDPTDPAELWTARVTFGGAGSYIPLVCYGQSPSLPVGGASTWDGASTALHIIALLTGSFTLLTPNTGPETYTTVNAGGAYSTALVPLASDSRERQNIAAAYFHERAGTSLSGRKVVAINPGRSGAAIYTLGAGSATLNTWLNDYAVIRAQADSEGVGVSLPYIQYYGCEQDSRDPNTVATMLGKISQFMKDMDATWTERNGGVRVPILAAQVAIAAKYVDRAAAWAVSIAMLRANGKVPNWACILPRYAGDYLAPVPANGATSHSNSIHEVAEHYVHDGLQMAKWAERSAASGQRPAVLQFRKATRITPRSFRIEFDVPYAPIRFDTDRIAQLPDGCYGLSARSKDYGRKYSLNAPVIESGGTSMLVTSNEDIPAGALFLAGYEGGSTDGTVPECDTTVKEGTKTYAKYMPGWLLGMRCCWKDSDPTIYALDDGRGRPMDGSNYMMLDEVEITDV